jgi:hypothetical protein
VSDLIEERAQDGQPVIPIDPNELPWPVDHARRVNLFGHQ